LTFDSRGNTSKAVGVHGDTGPTPGDRSEECVGGEIEPDSSYVLLMPAGKGAAGSTSKPASKGSSKRSSRASSAGSDASRRVPVRAAARDEARERQRREEEASEHKVALLLEKKQREDAEKKAFEIEEKLRKAETKARAAEARQRRTHMEQSKGERTRGRASASPARGGSGGSSHSLPQDEGLGSERGGSGGGTSLPPLPLPHKAAAVEKGEGGGEGGGGVTPQAPLVAVVDEGRVAREEPLRKSSSLMADAVAAAADALAPDVAGAAGDDGTGGGADVEGEGAQVGGMAQGRQVTPLEGERGSPAADDMQLDPGAEARRQGVLFVDQGRDASRAEPVAEHIEQGREAAPAKATAQGLADSATLPQLPLSPPPAPAPAPTDAPAQPAAARDVAPPVMAQAGAPGAASPTRAEPEVAVSRERAPPASLAAEDPDYEDRPIGNVAPISSHAPAAAVARPASTEPEPAPSFSVEVSQPAGATVAAGVAGAPAPPARGFTGREFSGAGGGVDDEIRAGKTELLDESSPWQVQAGQEAPGRLTGEGSGPSRGAQQLVGQPHPQAIPIDARLVYQTGAEQFRSEFRVGTGGVKFDGGESLEGVEGWRVATTATCMSQGMDAVELNTMFDDESLLPPALQVRRKSPTSPTKEPRNQPSQTEVLTPGVAGDAARARGGGGG